MQWISLHKKNVKVTDLRKRILQAIRKTKKENLWRFYYFGKSAME